MVEIELAYSSIELSSVENIADTNCELRVASCELLLPNWASMLRLFPLRAI